MSINRCYLSGCLTSEPRQTATASGNTVVRFGIAVNDRRKNNQTGEWDNYTHFVDCTMFGKLAESTVVYLHKGVRVTVEGKLNYQTWEKDGQKYSKLGVIVNELVPPQHPRQQQTQQYQQPAYSAPSYTPPQQLQQLGIADTDISF